MALTRLAKRFRSFLNDTATEPYAYRAAAAGVAFLFAAAFFAVAAISLLSKRCVTTGWCMHAWMCGMCPPGRARQALH